MAENNPEFENSRPSFRALRESLLSSCLELVRRDLVARTWGNLSVATGKGTFLITPSGIPYEDLGIEDLVEVGIDDLAWSGSIKPSSEKELHALVYRLRPTVAAVAHTHQFWASAVAAARVGIPAGAGDSPSAAVPCAAYALPTTRPLARSAAKAFAENPEARSVLLANHGAVCVGETMQAAIEEASRLESLSRSFILGRFERATGPLRDSSADRGLGGSPRGASLGLDALLAAFVERRGRVAP